MWDDARQTGAGGTGRGGDDLAQQAYLLTGDRVRAGQLARRALAAAAQHSRRAGPGGADDVARAELVRTFVAEPLPGAHGAEPLPPGRHAAAWIALGGLPARRRAVLVLRFGEGLSEEQIAARLDSTPRTVLADLEAGLLTLSPALNGAPEAGRLVAAALADASRRFANRTGSPPSAPRSPAPRPPAFPAPVPAAERVGSWSALPAAPAGGAATGDPWPWWAPASDRDRAAATAGRLRDLPPLDERPQEASAAGGSLPTGHPSGPHPQVGPSTPGDTRPSGRRVRPPVSGGTRPPFTATPLPLGAPTPRRRVRSTQVIGAAVVTALVLGAAMLVLPSVFGGKDRTFPGAGAGPTPSQAAAVVPSVPTRSVPKGLLDWPARGPEGEDEQVLAAATAAWKAKAPAAERPTAGINLLYAGILDGRHVALLQGLDRAGKPRVAQVSGPSPSSYALVHAEPLMGMAEVLSILPPDGRAGRLRVLVSPEGQAADGLLASDVSSVPLSKVRLDSAGVSDILPSPPGAPTCSRVVLMGLPAPLGRTGPRVLESGIVSADMLEAMMGEVEVGSSTLAGGDNAVPETLWFTDGALLARKIGGGKVTIAALGPRIAPRALTATDRRSVYSRAYEVRRGSQRFVGSVVNLGPKIVCVTALRVAPGQQSALSGYALRCPLPGGTGTMGLLHVVGGADVQSVQVTLDPTKAPPGQTQYASSVDRPATGATSGFAELDVVESGFPCGSGTIQATGTAGTSQPMALPVFTP